MISVTIIATLLILNALYVAAEFAVVSSSRLIIEKKALEGHIIAGILHKTQSNSSLMDQYIGSAQMGITVASLAIGMYGEHILAEWFHSWLIIAGIPQWISSHGIASILSVIFLTYFHIVMGEMIPKSLSLQKPETMAMIVTPCIIITKYSFYPIIRGINYLSNTMIKLMGIKRDVTAGENYTSEELEFIVKESQKEGLLKKETGEFFREILDFKSLTACEIMVPRIKITGIPFDIDKEGLKKILSENLHSRYPVYKENLDHITGMLHMKDIIEILEREGKGELKKIRPLPYVPETVTLDKILAAMGEHNTQMAIILDEYGGTAGLVTIEDIFEEVVGEFDEGKISEYLYKDKKGNLHVPGTVRLDEVGDFFKLDLTHEDVTTVSGLILSLLEKPPKMGDTVSYKSVKFKVTALEGYGVKECEVLQVQD